MGLTPETAFKNHGFKGGRLKDCKDILDDVLKEMKEERDAGKEGEDEEEGPPEGPPEDDEGRGEPPEGPPEDPIDREGEEGEGDDDGDDTEPDSNPNDDDDAFNSNLDSLDDFDELPAPTAEEIDNMDLPDDMDRESVVNAIDSMNVSQALKNRARIKAVKSDILKRIVPPSDEIVYEGGKEYEYETGLPVAKSHIWAAEKSIMGFEKFY